ncbi:MAG: hypothetical protein R3E89_12090 [Thiolinea sp.]
MSYPESTQSLLDQASHASGHGFDIVYDASLPVSSSVRLAGRENRERHETVLRLPSDENNYLIAWQAAFVLHQYRMPKPSGPICALIQPDWRRPKPNCWRCIRISRLPSARASVIMSSAAYRRSCVRYRWGC